MAVINLFLKLHAAVIPTNPSSKTVLLGFGLTSARKSMSFREATGKT